MDIDVRKVEGTVMTRTYIEPTSMQNMQEYTCQLCGEQTFAMVYDTDDEPKFCSRCGAEVRIIK